MTIVVDTSAVIEAIRQSPQALMALATAEEVLLPFVVLAELEAGVRCSDRPESERQKIDRFVARMSPRIIWADEATVELWAELRAAASRPGRTRAANDLWIAALARQHGAPVLAYDAHFDGLPGVEVQRLKR